MSLGNNSSVSSGIVLKLKENFTDDANRYAYYNYSTYKYTATANRINYGIYNRCDTRVIEDGHSCSMYGIYNYLVQLSGGTISTICGDYSSSLNNATTGTVDSMLGSYCVSQNNVTGTATTIRGVYARARNDQGPCTNLMGVDSFCQQSVAGGTTTTAKGVNSTVTRTAGTLTTGYLYYGTFSGTIGTKWGFYLNGETSNFLSGDLCLGTTVGVAALTIEDGTIGLKETSAPSNSAGYGKIYVNSSDADLHFLDESGDDINISKGWTGTMTVVQSLGLTCTRGSYGVSDFVITVTSRDYTVADGHITAQGSTSSTTLDTSAIC